MGYLVRVSGGRGGQLAEGQGGSGCFRVSVCAFFSLQVQPGSCLRKPVKIPFRFLPAPDGRAEVYATLLELVAGSSFASSFNFCFPVEAFPVSASP